MPSLRTEDILATSTAKISSTKSTAKSLFAVALQAFNLCVFLVVVAALLLLSPAAVVILLPVACMAASVCLLCATTARLLIPSVPPGRGSEDLGGVRERKKQDCVEVDRAEAPAGGFGDGGASSAEEEHGEQEQGRSFSFSPFDEEFSGYWGDDDDEQGRFFFVDTSSYCRTVRCYSLVPERMQISFFGGVKCFMIYWLSGEVWREGRLEAIEMLNIEDEVNFLRSGVCQVDGLQNVAGRPIKSKETRALRLSSFLFPAFPFLALVATVVCDESSSNACTESC